MCFRLSNQFRLDKEDHIHHNHASRLAEKSQFWSTVWGDRKHRIIDRKTDANFGQSILTAKKNYLNRINHGNMPEKGQFKTKVAYANHARDGANAYIERIGKRKESCQIISIKKHLKSLAMLLLMVFIILMSVRTRVFFLLGTRGHCPQEILEESQEISFTINA